MELFSNFRANHRKYQSLYWIPQNLINNEVCLFLICISAITQTALPATARTRDLKLRL